MDKAIRYKGMGQLRALCAMIGVEVETLLRHARLPQAYLTDEGRGFSAQQTFAAWNAAFDLVGPAKMSIELGRRMTNGPFTPQIFAFACSPDVTTGLERLAIFKPIVGPYRLDLRRTPDAVILSVRSPDIDAPLPSSMQPTEIGFLLEMIRTCSGSAIRPLWITMHPDSHSFEDATYYAGCDIRLGPILEIALSHQDASRRLMSENADQWRYFEPGLRLQLDAVLDQLTHAARVQGVLLELLPGGLATIEAACERLQTSKRSLQRHLKTEGTSFNAVLTETRHKLALHYLSQHGLRIEEISHLLAFRDPNSFYRAFHGWTGMTPQVARQTAKS
ncbi:helix-turn-helix domain-containing protein [Shimia ponticola]|uniref:helix-turn-helix domain-containing protein n=1 Tax=Shimia ponticola TaxID=2582893 RepID=UPI0011BE9861|nr:AraC family transcriptional regulator [Shimia ponticola]